MPASPLRIAVTGAAGQVGYGLPFRIASGEMLAPDRLQHEWLGQAPRGECEPDQRWQRHHYCLKIGVAGSGEDLLQDPREALKRQLSGAEQVMEPGNGRDPVVFVSPVQRCCNREVFVHGHHLAPEDPRI